MTNATNQITMSNIIFEQFNSYEPLKNKQDFSTLLVIYYNCIIFYIIVILNIVNIVVIGMEGI